VTAEELEQLVRGNDPQKLVAALAPLQEPERRKLAKTAAALLRQAQHATRQAFHEPPTGGWNRAPYRAARVAEDMAELAAVGLCAWTDARRVVSRPWGLAFDHVDHVMNILQSRRPDWIDKWIEVQLSSDWCKWGMIRELVRDGVCAKPTSNAYILRMFRHHAGWNNDRNMVLADWLRQDPELLQDEIWRIFEVDCGRHEVSGSWEFESNQPYSWGRAFLELINTGELDRQRVLSASLQALHRRHQNANNAAWFYHLHEKLEPTPDERTPRQELYLDLLSNNLPAVVGFALDGLKVVAQQGQLDVAGFVEAVAPVFDLRPKTHPATALRILKLAAKQAPDQKAPIALAASRGLAHSSPDVQKACLDLLDTLATSPDAALAEVLRQRLEYVVSSQQSRVQLILAKINPANIESSPPPSVAVPEPQAGDHANAGYLESLAKEARDIPANWRASAGIDALLAAIESGADLPALTLDPMAVPRLDPQAKLTPIANFDELVDGLSAAVEGLDDADQLERLLDGMSRLADQRRLDFALRTAPLLKRVNDLAKQQHWIGQLRLYDWIRAWITDQPMSSFPQNARWVSQLYFLTLRMAALTERVRKRIAAPLLAFPTHRRGWLDPRELVARLQSWPPGAQPDKYDLIQAILRLAPDHRGEALIQASTLAGETRAVIRVALGGDELPQATQMPGSVLQSTINWVTGNRAQPVRDLDLWIAAVRAREPNGEFPSLVSKPDALGPDAALPARYAWSVRKPEGWRDRGPQLQVEVSPPIQDSIASLGRPTVMLNYNNVEQLWAMDTVLCIRSRLAMWPADADGMFAHGARAIVSRLNNPASSLSPTSPYLEPLFDTDTPFSEMAQLCLAVALLSKDAGTRGMAVDAFIALIQDGRSNGSELGAIYARLSAMPQMVRLNRLADALTEVARVSDLHRHAAIALIEQLLAASTPPLRDDLHYVLSPLAEWLSGGGRALSSQARFLLQSVTGAGKTAKLAAVVLAQTDSSSPAPQVYAQALRGRIDRARRWQNNNSHH